MYTLRLNRKLSNYFVLHATDNLEEMERIFKEQVEFDEGDASYDRLQVVDELTKAVIMEHIGKDYGK